MGTRARVVVTSFAVLLWAAAGSGRASAACGNEALRIGAGALLPDCRAYELVTPRRASFPSAATGVLEQGFPVPTATAAGDGFMFAVTGSPAESEGGGVRNVFRAWREADGWHSSLAGPTGPEATVSHLVGYSSDLRDAAFEVNNETLRSGGSLDTGDPYGSTYLREGTGPFRLVGLGTLPANPDGDGFENGLLDEPAAAVGWISPGAGHVIFTSRAAQLLEQAPSSGVSAVYDRTPQGLRLVSVLPGEVVPETPSSFEGSSADGSVVLFQNGSSLYARVDGSETQPVADEYLAPAGVSDDGAEVFYAAGGDENGYDLFSWDTKTRVRTQITTGHDAEFVNVSPDGSHVYFTSPSQLDGAEGVAGSPNLYLWEGTSIRFVATVAPADLSRPSGVFTPPSVGLAHWLDAARAEPLTDTSRVSADGSVLAFESAARLTGYDNAGRVEIYRWEAATGLLSCVSCAPSGAPPSGDATFADYGFRHLGPSSLVSNLSADGSTVFFETPSALLPADRDGVGDVYEWRNRTLSLISAGSGSAPSTLVGATPSAGDVFIRTADELVPAGQEAGVPAIYDAREGGGFPPPAGAEPCEDRCQGELAAPPAGPAVGSVVLRPVHRPRHCRPARHRHRRHRHHCPRRPRRHGRR